MTDEGKGSELGEENRIDISKTGWDDILGEVIAIYKADCHWVIEKDKDLGEEIKVYDKGSLIPNDLIEVYIFIHLYGLVQCIYSQNRKNVGIVMSPGDYLIITTKEALDISDVKVDMKVKKHLMINKERLLNTLKTL